MIVDWYQLREAVLFWLFPTLGVAAIFYGIAKGIDVLSKVRRDREISADVRKAYRYFKRIVERQREEGDEGEGENHNRV